MTGVDKGNGGRGERKGEERGRGGGGDRWMSACWLSEQNASVKWKLISCNSFKFFWIGRESSRAKLKCGELSRRKESGSYLEQPVAPAVEGGDDGGVDVAAIQTLEGGGKEGQEEKNITHQLSTDKRLTSADHDSCDL